MESNFIKERVVIREEIIRKNIQAAKKESTSKDLTLDYSLHDDKVLVLEELVNEKLKRSLFDITQQEDRISSVVADYLKIRSALKIFKSKPKRLKVQTNIGCDFYAQCIIEDASKVYICLGKDYYLHMGLDEAIKMIDFKEQQLKKQLDLLQEKASRIKAYIKLSLECIGRFQDLSLNETHQVS